jgi:ankyrin repeat protein
MLLNAGHDANALDMHKATPLHRAAASGNLETVTPLAPGIFPDNLYPGQSSS